MTTQTGSARSTRLGRALSEGSITVSFFAGGTVGCALTLLGMLWAGVIHF